MRRDLVSEIRKSIKRERFGRIDDIQGHPSGAHRRLTNLINMTEDVRKFAAEQAITESEAIETGLEQTATEFTEKGSEHCAKT